MLKKFFKSLNQKGQSMILFALLTPLLFAVAGASLDLGWYYLNLSKLQNAADAAALAGANVISDEKPELVGKFFGDISGEVDKKDSADELAERFLKLNWDTEKQPLKNSPKFFLYEDASSTDKTTYYYVVSLTENKFEHLFDIMNSVGDTKVTATSIAKVIYENPEPPPQDETPPEIDEDLPKLKAVNVISGNWEVEDAKLNGRWKPPTDNLENYFVQNALHSYDSDKIWLNYNNNVNTNYYKPGDYFRYSTVEVKPGKGRYKTGSASDEKYPDSLTFGFRQDIIRILPGALEIKEDGRAGLIQGKKETETLFEKDWDIRHNTPYNKKLEIKYINGKYLNGNGNDTWWDKSCDLRVHAIFNIGNFEVRQDKITKDNPYDILWVRIESEAFLPLAMFGVTGSKTTSHRQFKSVRQIILNINEDNTEKGSDGKFKYRPMVMFYDGPEKIDMSSNVRKSKPVILNLNKDFRGILFAPNSSVIINDNGHKFFGFIVAKEYRKLTAGKGHEVRHKNSNTMYVNDYGEIYSERTDQMNCGTYDTFGIVSFKDYDYEVEDHSQNNLFTL